ncbi:hypothetical protein [Pollutibacter soli]|uniref:hypothetical protein n=1 Tax=Pollutibacter soli TaxID=3034157 RepID=UPI0030136C2A
MRYNYARILAFLISFFSVTTVLAQKNIVLTEDLAKNSEEWKVKMGTQMPGKLFKMHFSDYSVISSKTGWTTTTTHGNLFNTETESKTKQKFSFRFAGKSTDTANVNAAVNISTSVIRALPMFPIVDWIIDSENARSLFATIVINQDTASIWAMYLQITSKAGQPMQSNGVLYSAGRRINFSPINSNRHGTDTRSMPAEGYEFTENDRAVGAVQYYGGGLMGMNKNIVWIHNSLDAKTKLTIASAMTAILESIYTNIPTE